MRTATLALAAALILAASTSAPASPYWSWTLSDSPTDPFSNSGQSGQGQTDYYLWFTGIALLNSMSKAELGLQSTGPVIASMQGMNGFTLQTQGPHVRVTPPASCSGGAVLAAHLVILDTPGHVYFGPSVFSGALCSSDCAPGPGVSFYYHLGYSWTPGEGPIESVGALDCASTAVGVDDGVTTSNWGRTKAEYR